MLSSRLHNRILKQFYIIMQFNKRPFPIFKKNNNIAQMKKHSQANVPIFPHAIIHLCFHPNAEAEGTVARTDD